MTQPDGVTTGPQRADAKVVHSFCRLCIAQCGVLVEVEGDEILSVRGDPDHPVTRGYTCPKGRALGALHRDRTRLDRPQMRVDGYLVDTSWEIVLDDLADKLKAVIAREGVDAIGVYLGVGTGMDTAGRAVAQAFPMALGTKSLYTSMTLDTPSKPLIRHLMLGHPHLEPLGDVDSTEFLLLLGTNPVVSHGHTWSLADPITRLRAIARRGQLWVIDPRHTESARLATRHLAVRPGSDYALVAHLVRELLAAGADAEYIGKFTTGAEVLRAATEGFTATNVASTCGVSEDDLDALVAAIRAAGRISVLTGTGATMGPAANAVEWLVMALCAITGSLDRPGGMWFNPGYVTRLDRVGVGTPTAAVSEPGPTSRPELPRRWAQFPTSGLLTEVESGSVQALFVAGGNLVASAPQPDRFARAMRRLDVCAVADIVESPQVRVASHVLPCTGPLERPDVTFLTQTYFPDVVGQYSPAIVRPVSERRPLWWIVAQIAARLGVQVVPDGVDVDAASDDAVIDALLGADAVTALKTHPSGSVAADVERFGWIVGSEHIRDGRIALAPEELVEQLGRVSPPDADLVLAPRREVRHVNSLFTARDERDRPRILMHPGDADPRGIRTDDDVLVTSAHGSVTGVAQIDPGGSRGYVSIAQGFVGASEPNVGNLTSSEQDIDSLTGMVLQAGVELTVTKVAATTQ